VFEKQWLLTYNIIRQTLFFQDFAHEKAKLSKKLA
jgi:hypothetical protein